MSRPSFRTSSCPRIGNFQSLNEWADAVASYIDQTFGRVERSAVQRDRPVAGQYDVTNKTESRSLDCNGTVDQVADVVGTLIDDLKTKGVLRGKG